MKNKICPLRSCCLNCPSCEFYIAVQSFEFRYDLNLKKIDLDFLGTFSSIKNQHIYTRFYLQNTFYGTGGKLVL